MVPVVRGLVVLHAGDARHGDSPDTDALSRIAGALGIPVSALHPDQHPTPERPVEDHAKALLELLAQLDGPDEREHLLRLVRGFVALRRQWRD